MIEGQPLRTLLRTWHAYSGLTYGAAETLTCERWGNQDQSVSGAALRYAAAGSAGMHYWPHGLMRRQGFHSALTLMQAQHTCKMATVVASVQRAGEG